MLSRTVMQITEKDENIHENDDWQIRQTKEPIACI